MNSRREHVELLGSSRDEVGEYKNSLTVSEPDQSSGSVTPGGVQLLRERAAIYGSISHMDEVIIQAENTKLALGSQRELIGGTQGKGRQLKDRFPVIRDLLGSIQRKKSRDTLILSAVIAACTVFIIIYWLSK